MMLDREVIDRFRDAVAKRYGLLFGVDRRDFLGEVLAKQTGRTKNADAYSYVQRLLSGNLLQSESSMLVAELTVGETYFFRHHDQFRAFAHAVFAAQQPQGPNRRLHILSAGCASGEEAYTLAILLRQHLPDFAAWDIRILGIDLNPMALARAVQGRYTTWSLRGVSDDLRQRFFRPVEKDFQLDDSIRKMVSFEERNLANDASGFWSPEVFNVIFCRNVLMYFTPEAARAAVARLTRSLVPDGFLFLSPAETLRGLSNAYHLRHTHEAFYYQRRGAGERYQDPPFEACCDFGSTLATSPSLPGPNDSWVNAIAEASERIARLGTQAQPRSEQSDLTSEGPSSSVGKLQTGIVAAQEMLRQERYDEALRALDATASQGMQDSDAQLLRAAILTNCGDVAEAERLCREVLSRDELNAEARYLLALCREHTKEYEGAEEQDAIAIYLDARFAMPHLHLGLLRKRANDWVGACQSFRNALTLLPGEDAARILLFGGGFSREMLIRMCAAELRGSGDQP